MTMSIARLPHGVNERFTERFICIESGTVADDASFSVTIPAEYIGTGAVARCVAAWTYGAGAVGARTKTNLPLVNTGSALVGVEETTFVETTGVLTIVNRSGGNLTTCNFLIEVVAAAA